MFFQRTVYNGYMDYYHFRSFGKQRGKIAHESIKVNGRSFDSRAEYERWLELRDLEQRGVISELKDHPQFEIIPRQVGPDGNILFRNAKYTADFSYIRDGKLIVEDVKSEFTRMEKDYILRRKLMLFHNGIYVTEVIR